MTPKKIWANFAVNNLNRTTTFYTALGFKANGKPNAALTSFLFGNDDFVIHFFLTDILKKNMQGDIVDAQTANEIIFTLSAETKAEVDSWAIEVENAGGKLISSPDEFGEGYYGFVFADPDGHWFNVFYM